MKKVVILFAVTFMCITGFARNTGSNWLETASGKVDCKEINLGLTKATVVLEDGKTVDYNFDAINSFSKDGKVYTKLMLYEDNKPTNQLVFMELIKTWNDLSFYRLKVQNLGQAGPGSTTDRYYLYKGMNFYVQLDDRSLKNTCKEFGVDFAGL
jgi:hypothetical protein